MLIYSIMLYNVPLPQGAKLKQLYLMKEGKINKRISSLHCAFLQKHRIAVPKSPVSVIQIRFLSASSGLPGRRYSRILFALFILPGSAMEVWNNVSVTGDWADTMADLLLLL